MEEGRPYWKTPELWECRVVGPGATGSAAEQAYECLVIALGLGVGWQVLGALSPDRADDFSGVWDVRGNRSVVPGLEWASFHLVATTTADPTSRKARSKREAQSE